MHSDGLLAHSRMPRQRERFTLMYGDLCIISQCAMAVSLVVLVLATQLERPQRVLPTQVIRVVAKVVDFGEMIRPASESVRDSAAVAASTSVGSSAAMSQSSMYNRKCTCGHKAQVAMVRSHRKAWQMYGAKSQPKGSVR